MRPGRGDGDLERRLEWELARTARRLKGPSPLPSDSAYHRFARERASRRLVSTLATASTKVAAGLVAACLLGAGGAVAATAATGSPNPVVWTRTVSREVDQQQTAASRAAGVESTPAPTTRNSTPPTPLVPAVPPTPSGSAAHSSRDHNRDENRDPGRQKSGHRGSPPASAKGGAKQGSPAAQPTSAPGHGAAQPGQPAHPSPAPAFNPGRGGTGQPSFQP